ncbi:DUF4145 domain-containing protein [uncultured Thiothrix sp.]|uniref:DUF4145 domain-containing protein n=1 Tax=uncultured Thiothrix sp. TaxID=223185 RepID=UPI0026236830|nr:DUF4145 domain-containing protein [uncultured Thiothrix sp.]HMT93255.1 hypothetical protein [Thiolinea sp.]
MAIHETFQRRFNELAIQFEKIPFARGEGVTRLNTGSWEGCATSALNLLKAVYGELSPYYKNFLHDYEKVHGSSSYLLKLKDIFLSAKQDFEGGYVFNVDLRISGEVFGDFIVLARQSLAEGHKNVAAVLASAALEDALKRYSTNQGIDITNKSMQEVVNALKSSGHVVGAQKSLLDAMPRIRNMAMHAEWDKISEPDVNSIIGFVESFLLTKFS